MSTSTITSQGVNISTEQSVPTQVLSKQQSVPTQVLSKQQTVNEQQPGAIPNANQVSVVGLEQLGASDIAVKDQKPVQSEALVDQSIESVANFVNSVNKNVDFLVDEDSGRTIIKVIDVESQELIKQFPSEEIISMAKRIKELQEQITSKTGLFLDENV